MPPFAQTFLEKALVNLSMPNTALEQEVIVVAITIALVILYLHASDVQCTPTQHIQPKPSSDFALRRLLPQ